LSEFGSARFRGGELAANPFLRSLVLRELLDNQTPTGCSIPGDRERNFQGADFVGGAVENADTEIDRSRGKVELLGNWKG